MKLKHMLTSADRKSLYELKDGLKPMPFKDLPDEAYFTVGKSGEVYKKIGNSHSISQVTNKDAIFSLRSRVQPVGTPT